MRPIDDEGLMGEHRWHSMGQMASRVVLNSNGAGLLYFDTDTLPPRDRFPTFCEEIVRRYTSLDIIKPDNTERFRSTIELQRVGMIDIGRLSTSPLNTIRSSRLVRDGDDALLIILVREGLAHHTQRGRDQKLEPGDGIICDCGYSGQVNFTSDALFWDLKVPRHLMARVLPGFDGFAGARLDKHPLARALLFGYLGGTHDTDFRGGGRAVALYEQHVIDLIALALGAQGEARKLAEEGGLRTRRRSAILREIERRSGNPGLSAVTIAASLGITPRYVHLLLEETGQSFSQHVLAARLTKAAALLRDPRRRNRRITEIALEAGFTDLSCFSRAFRRHYGATPSDVRAPVWAGRSG